MRFGWLPLYVISNSYCNDIVFIVLGYNRPAELRKTLDSLCKLRTEPGQNYEMIIHIDGPSTDVNETIHVARSYECQLFRKTVQIHDTNRGIVGQWVEAWSPLEDQYSLIIEDDIEISPHALKFLSALLLRFKEDPSLYGIALQRAQWQLGICERNRWRRLDLVEEEEYPQFFRFAAMGTWGQLLFPKPWRQFLAYARDAVQKEELAPSEGLLTEEWARRGRRLISPLFTRWALSTGYLNMYTNFGVGKAMAASRQPPGVNAQSQHKFKPDKFPSWHEIEWKLEGIDSVRSMSPCFDPTDLTADEHRTRYGIIVSIPEGLHGMERKKIECSLAVHRIYPLEAPDIVPRLEIHSGEGYFRVSPLEIKKRFEQGKRDKLVNIVFLDHDDQLIMSLVRRMGPSRAVYLSKDEFHPTATTTLNGACSKYFCPFVPGLYPDKSDLKFSEL